MKQLSETTHDRPRLWKIGLQLILILAISVGLWQGLLAPVFQDRALSSVQRWEVEYLTGGTIDLLADQLSRQPATTRQAYIDRLAPAFGFNISLREFSTLDQSNQVLERLERGEIVGDPSDYSAYMRLDRDDRVLVFDRIKLPADHLVDEAERRHMGTFSVLEELLRDIPDTGVNTVIESAASRFEYPVSTVEPEELVLSHTDELALRAGQIVTVETEDSIAADYPAEMAYKMIGANVLTLGPFSPPTLKRFYPVVSVYFVVLGLVVLLPLALWLAPTWRSMNHLTFATSAFGRGDFVARARTVKGSKTNHLIDVFNRMADKIQSLVESNKALINSVSHELRTPISRIEFNIELARQSNDIAERNQQLDKIEESVDELKTMVSEMLQYARFDREKPNFSMESVDLGEWLQSERKNWIRDPAEDFQIRIDVPNNPVKAPLERYYMSRAVSNLVRNARRFAKSKIVVAVTSVRDAVEISVSDDGPGIAYQERARVFEPFVRLDESRNRESGGTGLGLAIVKQIVTWHSGEVRVDEADIGGARFVIHWPRSEDKS